MEARTRYYIADAILGIITVSAIYVTIAMAHLYVINLTEKSLSDFEEPWVWFGSMTLLPLVIVFYDTILIKLGAIAYGYSSKYGAELTGRTFRPLTVRPLRYDFPVMMTFFLFTPYISQQIYGMMEGSSDMIIAVMSVIPAITCVCVMSIFQRLVAWNELRNKGEHDRKRAEAQKLREALE